MAFTTITNADLVNKGVKGLPDTPEMEASELKARFDSLGDLTVEKFKQLVIELEEQTAALSLGARVPTGLSASKNVQSIIDALYIIVHSNALDSHTHTSLAALNGITPRIKEGYDQTVLKFDSIRSVEQIVNDSDSEIPTSGAVVDYVNARLAALGH